jgi:hypothetical protein
VNAKRKGTRTEHRSRRLLETAGYAVTGTIARKPLPAAAAPRKGGVGNRTLDAAAAESRLSVRTIRRAYQSSRVPLRHYRNGARVVIACSDLQQWLKGPVVRQRTSEDSGWQGSGVPIKLSATARACTAAAAPTGRGSQ